MLVQSGPHFSCKHMCVRKIIRRAPTESQPGAPAHERPAQDVLIGGHVEQAACLLVRAEHRTAGHLGRCALVPAGSAPYQLLRPTPLTSPRPVYTYMSTPLSLHVEYCSSLHKGTAARNITWPGTLPAAQHSGAAQKVSPAPRMALARRTCSDAQYFVPACRGASSLMRTSTGCAPASFFWAVLTCAAPPPPMHCPEWQTQAQACYAITCSAAGGT